MAEAWSDFVRRPFPLTVILDRLLPIFHDCRKMRVGHVGFIRGRTNLDKVDRSVISEVLLSTTTVRYTHFTRKLIIIVPAYLWVFLLDKFISYLSKLKISDEIGYNEFTSPLASRGYVRGLRSLALIGPGIGRKVMYI